MTKSIKTKKKILKALEPQKTFKISWMEEVVYEKEVKGISEEDVRDKFYDGEIEIDSSKDIIDGNMVDDSLEIEEVE